MVPPLVHEYNLCTWMLSLHQPLAQWVTYVPTTLKIAEHCTSWYSSAARGEIEPRSPADIGYIGYVYTHFEATMARNF